MKNFQTTQSELVQYNGMSCEVLGELDENLYDKADVGTMYHVQLESGKVIQAFEDEIV